jgi:hypothetical protein
MAEADTLQNGIAHQDEFGLSFPPMVCPVFAVLDKRAPSARRAPWSGSTTTGRNTSDSSRDRLADPEQSAGVLVQDLLTHLRRQ